MVAESTASNLIIWRLLEPPAGVEPATCCLRAEELGHGRRINRKQLDYLAFVGATRRSRTGDLLLTIGAAGAYWVIRVSKLSRAFFTSGLEGLAIDGKGLRPEGFEEACEKHRPKALYCMPTVRNPTGSIMSEQRRHRIAEIARRNRVAIIE